MARIQKTEGKNDSVEGPRRRNRLKDTGTSAEREAVETQESGNDGNAGRNDNKSTEKDPSRLPIRALLFVLFSLVISALFGALPAYAMVYQSRRKPYNVYVSRRRGAERCAECV